jgi:hypothetical protein
MGFEVIYSIKDGKGKNSTCTIALPTSVSYASAVSFGIEMAKLVDSLITGQITRAGVAFVIDLSVVSGLKSSPGANSDVEEGAKFQFRTVLNHPTGLRLPTFDETYIVAGSDAVNLTATQVAAFVAGMINGVDIDPSPTTTLVQPSDQRSEDITALSFAREAFQSSRGRVN